MTPEEVRLATRESGALDTMVVDPSHDDLGADIKQMRRRLPSLEAVERRRGQLWIVAGVLLVATSAAVFLLVASPEAADLLPDNPGLRLGFLGTSLAFLLYVFDQERRMRHLSEALVKERVLSSALESRIRDLATLSRVGQVVNSVLTMEEVLEIVLQGAFELTEAVTGSVMLADDDDLVVAVSAGRARAPAGSRQPLDAGVAGQVATRREPMLITGSLSDGQVSDRQTRRRPAASSVIAPMLLGEELLGVLAIERAPDAEPFTEWQLRAVALFANHAATAVTNARRYESERSNVERLADMLERRTEFVATLVHDLKAPLSAIIGFTALLRRRGDDLGADRRGDALDHIDAAAQDLLGMIDDILRGASVEAAAPVRPQPVELRGFLEQLAETTRSMADAHGDTDRQVRVHAPRDVTLHADRQALRSVMLNLLENAVKYSPAGSPIDLVLDVADDEVRLAVVDQGEGIPADEQEKIFQRFRQRDSSVGPEGVGLGLYIVRSLVLAQGGRIWVESAPGEGAAFWVALPRRRFADA